MSNNKVDYIKRRVPLIAALYKFDAESYIKDYPGFNESTVAKVREFHNCMVILYKVPNGMVLRLTEEKLNNLDKYENTNFDYVNNLLNIVRSDLKFDCYLEKTGKMITIYSDKLIYRREITETNGGHVALFPLCRGASLILDTDYDEDDYEVVDWSKVDEDYKTEILKSDRGLFTKKSGYNVIHGFEPSQNQKVDTFEEAVEILVRKGFPYYIEEYTEWYPVKGFLSGDE